MKENQGFRLIDKIALVAIIAILAYLAYPVVNLAFHPPATPAGMQPRLP